MPIAYTIARRIAQKQRTTFTRTIIRISIIAIALSVSVMILTTAIMSGFKKEITQKIFGFWGHIHITNGNINRTFDLQSIPKNPEYLTNITNISRLEYTPDPPQRSFIPWKNGRTPSSTYGGVKGCYPYIILPGLLSTKEAFHGGLIKGVDPDYDWNRLSTYIIRGRPIRFTADSLASPELIVSKYIAQTLSIDIGDKIILSFIIDDRQIKKRFEICGIYNTGLEEYDKRFCLADLSKVQEILQWTPDEVQGFEVVLDDMRDMDIVSDYIYYDIIPQDLYAESIKSKFPGIFEWLSLQDINEKVILQLMVFVAIMNMITVLLILILERTTMIGILKTLGMSNDKVRHIFLYHAAYIVLAGLFLGNLFGLSIALLQKKFGFISLDESNYYLDTAPIYVDWWTILLINVFTFIITLICLILPTLLVTRISPVRALRFG